MLAEPRLARLMCTRSKRPASSPGFSTLDGMTRFRGPAATRFLAGGSGLVLIGSGMPLFGALPHDVKLRHVATGLIAVDWCRTSMNLKWDG